MESTEDKCVSEIIDMFNKYSAKTATLYLSPHENHEKSLYMNTNTHAKIYIDNKKHTLLNCRLLETSYLHPEKEPNITSKDLINVKYVLKKLDKNFEVMEKAYNTKYGYNESYEEVFNFISSDGKGYYFSKYTWHTLNKKDKFTILREEIYDKITNLFK